MDNSTSQLRPRKETVFYVPQSFRPDEALRPQLRVHTQSACYLMYMIIRRLAHGEHDCARLKMEYLENVMGKRHASTIRKALENSGDIRRVRPYTAGKHAFGYLRGEQYRGQRLRAFHPTNPELLERLARVHEQIWQHDRRNWLPIHETWESWQQSLTIDIHQARTAIARLPIRESFPGVWAFVRNFSRNDHAALLCKLQNIESDLVIMRVGQRLQQLGCSGCISLHDAVFCARNDLGNVRRAFCEVFTSMDIRLKLDDRFSVATS